MSDSFEVQAQVRVDEGKGASRRLRRLEGKVPGVVYGGEAAAISISLIRKDLEKMMEQETFYASVLNVNVDGSVETAILKDVQRHPAKGFPMHVDFLRVQARESPSHGYDLIHKTRASLSVIKLAVNFSRDCKYGQS